jgi:hypothetical protein
MPGLMCVQADQSAGQGQTSMFRRIKKAAPREVGTAFRSTGTRSGRKVCRGICVLRMRSYGGTAVALREEKCHRQYRRPREEKRTSDFGCSYCAYAASHAMRRTSERAMPKSAKSRLLSAPSSLSVVLYTRRFARRVAAAAKAFDAVAIRRSSKVAFDAVSVKYVMFTCPFGTASS